MSNLEKLAHTYPISTFSGETQRELIDFVLAAVAEAQKAFGGCTNCYGKGYASVNDRWVGHDTDTDIGSPGGYISGGDANAMKFCSCERGKELERRIAALRGKR